MHGAALSGLAVSDEEQSVPAPPKNIDKRCRNEVAVSPGQTEVYAPAQKTMGRVLSLPEGARRKSVRLRSPQVWKVAALMSSWHSAGGYITEKQHAECAQRAALEKARKKSPRAWRCAVRAGRFGWEQSVPGTPFRRTPTSDAGTGLPSRHGKQKSGLRCRRPWGGSSPCPRRPSKIDRLRSPQSLT
jgi:hypothetical protein